MTSQWVRWQTVVISDDRWSLVYMSVCVNSLQCVLWEGLCLQPLTGAVPPPAWTNKTQDDSEKGILTGSGPDIWVPHLVMVSSRLLVLASSCSSCLFTLSCSGPADGAPSSSQRSLRAFDCTQEVQLVYENVILYFHLCKVQNVLLTRSATQFFTYSWLDTTWPCQHVTRTAAGLF